MERFLIDRHISPRDELIALLAYNGVKYSEDKEGLRFALEDGPHVWETVCRYAGLTVLIYGLYPFETAGGEQTLRVLDRINGELTRGSMFLGGGRVVMRTGADLYDAFSAYEAIARAIEYNAGAIVKYWQTIRFHNTKAQLIRKEDAPH